MGAAGGKAFTVIGGQPMVLYALRTLAQLPDLVSIVLAVSADHHEQAAVLLAHSGPWAAPVVLARGGAERQDSVAAGLALVDTTADLIIVHDAARPFVSLSCFEACVASAAYHGAAIVALPAHDTIKVVNAAGEITATLDRRTIWLAQTPQAFHANLLRRAYARAQADSCAATDDAMLVERLGATVHVVPGSSQNRKITTPEDREWAESYVASQRIEPSSSLRSST